MREQGTALVCSYIVDLELGPYHQPLRKHLKVTAYTAADAITQAHVQWPDWRVVDVRPCQS